MRRHELLSVITFFATLVFALAAAKLLAPKLIGRDATMAELTVIAVCLCIVALWNRARSSRRQRQRLDQIRDSALW
jgi:Flp pilus assembly protein TadB